MAPFFARITGKDRAVSVSKGSQQSSEDGHTSNSALSSSTTNNFAAASSQNHAPRIAVNEDNDDDEPEANTQRTTTNAYGLASARSSVDRRQPPAPIAATPTGSRLQVDNDYEIMTPTATHPGPKGFAAGPPPGLVIEDPDGHGVSEISNALSSRNSSVASLALNRKESAASLRNPAEGPGPGRRSRRGSVASSDGSVHRSNTNQTVTQASPTLPNGNATIGRSSSMLAGGLLAAPTIDSDNVSIRSGVSTSGKKKRIWSSKKQSAGGIAGALAQSGMSLAYPGAGSGMPASPPLRPQPGSPPRVPRRGSSRGHVPRTSIDSVLHPRRTSVSSPPRVSDEHEVYPEDSDDVYESPDAFSFDDDDIPVTGFAVASSKRNADFHELFPDIEDEDYLIEDYGCAMQRDILVQGRLYISENHLCFHANIFGWITNVTIAFADIIGLEKKMTAFVIPNAIQVATRQSRYTFASFITRDTSFDVINNIWRLARPARNGMDEHASLRSDSLDNGTSVNGTAANGSAVDSKRAPTECACGKKGEHYDTVMMDCVMPGTPAQIHALMWTSGFIKDFMVNNQKLTEIQTSDWAPMTEGSHLLSRTLSYIKPLNNSLGPKSTKCECVDETVHADFDDYFSNVTTTRTPNVPSGGAFSVKTRTCLMWAGTASTRIKVTSNIEWTGRSYIKSMIERGAMEGQRSWHVDLEAAMRAYINQHKNEFFPAGAEVPDVETQTIEDPATALGGVALTGDDLRKVKQRETEQRGLQWALDTFNGAFNVGKQSAKGAIDIIGDMIENSSSTSILVFIVVILVVSNLWTMSNLKSAQKKHAQQRYEMRRNEGTWPPYVPPPPAPTPIIADSEALRAILESVISRTAPVAPISPTTDAPLSPGDELRSIQDAVHSLEARIANLKSQVADTSASATLD